MRARTETTEKEIEMTTATRQIKDVTRRWLNGIIRTALNASGDAAPRCMCGGELGRWIVGSERHCHGCGATISYAIEGAEVMATFAHADGKTYKLPITGSPYIDADLKDWEQDIIAADMA